MEVQELGPEERDRRARPDGTAHERKQHQGRREQGSERPGDGPDRQRCADPDESENDDDEHGEAHRSVNLRVKAGVELSVRVVDREGEDAGRRRDAEHPRSRGSPLGDLPDEPRDPQRDDRHDRGEEYVPGHPDMPERALDDVVHRKYGGREPEARDEGGPFDRIRSGETASAEGPGDERADAERQLRDDPEEHPGREGCGAEECERQRNHGRTPASVKDAAGIEQPDDPGRHDDDERRAQERLDGRTRGHDS